jgi:hypothetical protein
LDSMSPVKVVGHIILVFYFCIVPVKNIPSYSEYLVDVLPKFQWLLHHLV